jgi:hypothetical protein
MCANRIMTHMSDATEIMVFSDLAGVRIKDAIEDLEINRPSHHTPLSEIMNVDSICGRKPNRAAIVTAFAHIKVDVIVLEHATFAATIAHIAPKSYMLCAYACCAIRLDSDPAWHETLTQLVPRLCSADSTALFHAVKARCAWIVHAWITMFRYAPISAVTEAVIIGDKDLFNELSRYMPRGWDVMYVCLAAIKQADIFFVSRLIQLNIDFNNGVLCEAVRHASLEVVRALKSAIPSFPWRDVAKRAGRTDMRFL